MYICEMQKIDADIIRAQIMVYVKRESASVSINKKFRMELCEMLRGHVDCFCINEKEAAYANGYIVGACSMWLARARNSYDLTYTEFETARRLIKRVADMATTDYTGVVE